MGENIMKEVGDFLLEYYNRQVIDQVRKDLKNERIKPSSEPSPDQKAYILLHRPDSKPTVFGKTLKVLLEDDERARVKFVKITGTGHFFIKIATVVQSSFESYFKEDNGRWRLLHPDIGKEVVVNFEKEKGNFSPDQEVKFHDFSYQTAAKFLCTPQSIPLESKTYFRSVFRSLIYLYHSNDQLSLLPDFTVKAVNVRKVAGNYKEKTPFLNEELIKVLSRFKASLAATEDSLEAYNNSVPQLELAIVHDKEGESVFQEILKANEEEFRNGKIKLHPINIENFSLKPSDLSLYAGVCFLMTERMHRSTFFDKKFSFIKMLDEVGKNNLSVSILVAHVGDSTLFPTLSEVIDSSAFGPLIPQRKVTEKGMSILFRKVASRVRNLSEELLHVKTSLDNSEILIKKQEEKIESLSRHTDRLESVVGEKEAALFKVNQTITSDRRLRNRVLTFLGAGVSLFLCYLAWPQNTYADFQFTELKKENVEIIDDSRVKIFEPFYPRFLDSRHLLVSNTYPKGASAVSIYDTENKEDNFLQPVMMPDINRKHEVSSNFGVIDDTTILVIPDRNDPPYIILLDKENLSADTLSIFREVSLTNKEAKGDAVDISLNKKKAVVTYYQGNEIFLLDLEDSTENVLSINLMNRIDRGRTKSAGSPALKPSGVAFHYKRGSENPAGFVTCLNIPDDTTHLKKIWYFEMNNDTISRVIGHPESGKDKEYFTDIRIINDYLIAISDSKSRIYSSDVSKIDEWQQGNTNLTEVYAFSEGGTPADIDFDPMGTRAVILHQQNARVDVLYLTSTMTFDRIEEYSFQEVLLESKSQGHKPFKARGVAVKWSEGEVFITDQEGGRLLKLKIPL